MALAGLLPASAETSTVFYESFDQCESTGGNDDSWSGSVANGTLTADNEGWTFANGYGAFQCAKFGTGSKKGSAQTPALTGISTAANVESTTLTFRAGAWNSSSEKTTLNLLITTGELSVSVSTVTLEKGKFNDYTVTITGATEDSKITFEAANASNNRFFLDEVKVVQEMSEAVVVPDAPTFNPYSGATVAGSLTVNIITNVSGGVVHYTTDGSTPTLDSPTGTAVRFLTPGTYTLKAIVAVGNVTSAVATATYTITASGASDLEEGDYELVTDASTLTAGDLLILVSSATAGEANAASTAEQANFRPVTAVTVQQKSEYIVVHPGEDVEVFELRGSAGAWMFKSTIGDYGFLTTASTGTNNYLQYTSASTTDNSKATIEIGEDYAATIHFLAGNRTYLRYNGSSGSERFSCYETDSNVKPAYLYRKVTNFGPKLETVEGIAAFKTIEPGVTVKLYLPVDGNARVLHVVQGEGDAVDAYVRDNTGAMMMHGIVPSRPMARDQHLAGWICGKYYSNMNGLPLFVVDNELTNTDELVIADPVTEAAVTPKAIAADEMNDNLADWVKVSDLRFMLPSRLTVENAFDEADYEEPYTGALVDMTGIVGGTDRLYPLATAGEPLVTYVMDANQSFVMPPYDLENVTVRWEHMLFADAWNPVVVPFDYYDFPGQVAFYTGVQEGEQVLNSVTGEMIDNGEMQFTSIEGIEAGVPVIVKPESNVQSMTITGTTLHNTPEEVMRYSINGPVNWGSGAPQRMTSRDIYSMEGTYTPTQVSDDYNTIKVLQSDGTWANGLSMEVPGGSAYFRTPSNQAMHIVVDGVKETTGISDVIAAPATARGIYNLMGVKMRGEWSDLPAGIYIVNGKKAIKR